MLVKIEKELLSLHIFLDNSLIEIYANNHTVITAHIYRALLDSTSLGYIVNGQDESVTFSNVSTWLNLQNAFPKRPANSSTTLVSNSSITTFISNIYLLSVSLLLIFHHEKSRIVKNDNGVF